MEQSTTGHVVWAAMGGWRGVLESVLPGLAFVLLYTFTQHLPLSLGVSVGLAAIFTIVRLVQRSTLSAALGGLIATGAAAATAAAAAAVCRPRTRWAPSPAPGWCWRRAATRPMASPIPGRRCARRP